VGTRPEAIAPPTGRNVARSGDPDVGLSRGPRGLGAVAAVPGPLEDASAVELVTGALAETRELVRLEIELAKNEIEDEIVHVKRAAVLGGAAIAIVLLALPVLVVALILALGGGASALGAVGGVLLALGVVLGLMAKGALPSRILEKTRNRLRASVEELKEHVT